MIDIEQIKEALELCITTIKILHPILDPEEPCIAFESVTLAQQALNSINKPVLERKTVNCDRCKQVHLNIHKCEDFGYKEPDNIEIE